MCPWTADKYLIAVLEKGKLRHREMERAAQIHAEKVMALESLGTRIRKIRRGEKHRLRPRRIR